MRAKPIFLTCAGMELARFFVLINASGSVASATQVSSLLQRVIAVPNTIFAVGFLFIGLDEARYAVYKPLLLVGKIAALFASAIVLPRLFGLGSAVEAPDAFTVAAVCGVALWDVVAVVALSLRRRAPKPQADGAPAAEPEIVELD